MGTHFQITWEYLGHIITRLIPKPFTLRKLRITRVTAYP